MRRLNLDSLRRQAKAAQAGEKFIPGCTGKVAYADYEEASVVRDLMRARLHRRVTCYRCRTCKAWHTSVHRKK